MLTIDALNDQGFRLLAGSTSSHPVSYLQDMPAIIERQWHIAACRRGVEIIMGVEDLWTKDLRVWKPSNR